MNKLLIAVVVFSIVPSVSTAQQNRKTIRGKVSSFVSDLQGIYVINQQTEKDTRTLENGNFAISVQQGDTLIFSSIRFKARKVAIAASDFEKGLFVVRLEPIMEQLQEVQVFQYKNINAVALGIIPKGQKTYTPAERKLKAGTDYETQFGLNSAMMLDPLLNAISGKSAELRKNIIVERKEMMLAKIGEMYESAYFIEKLGLPEEHVKGFQFYIVENPSFVQALKAKNKTMATFLIGELAVKYKQIVAQEKN